MDQVSIVELDIAKSVFQAHGADASGGVAFRKKIMRAKVLEFFASQPPCQVAMEACGGSHYWAREIGKLGHEVKLIAPKYVKPFVKRQKNDAADAEAICEAATRPTMRFVAVKSETAQASTLVFRTRDILVRQRTQITNPAARLPAEVRSILSLLVQVVTGLEEKISLLDKEIARRTKEDAVARRLMTIPGVGPITATAIAALAPPAATFRKGRDFAAWVGLTPLQKSTGGKQKLGSISKMGERTLRRLLIIGAAAAIQHAGRQGIPPGTWLARMLARKPRMLVTVALANKMARIVWALLVKGEDYRAPVVAAA